MAALARPTLPLAPRRRGCVTQPFELPAALKVQAASQTHVGLVRAANEDSVLAAQRMLAVADGMGGANGGAVASRIAVESLRAIAQVGDPAAALPAAVRCANAAVHGLAASAPDLCGMGTTLTAVALDDDALTVAHVGDSRLYRLRDRALERMTRDHTAAEEVRLRGGAPGAVAPSLENVLVRAVGARAEVEVDVAIHEGRSGDRWLLCSDGLTKHLGEDEIGGLLGAASGPEEAARALVDVTLARGATDNVSVVAFQLA